MKKKLKLNDLEVKSFVTSLDKNDLGGIYGASGYPCQEPSNHCTTPVMPSRDADCFFTRFNQNCIVASGGDLC